MIPLGYFENKCQSLFKMADFAFEIIESQPFLMQKQTIYVVNIEKLDIYLCSHFAIKLS